MYSASVKYCPRYPVLLIVFITELSMLGHYLILLHNLKKIYHRHRTRRIIFIRIHFQHDFEPFEHKVLKLYENFNEQSYGDILTPVYSIFNKVLCFSYIKIKVIVSSALRFLVIICFYNFENIPNNDRTWVEKEF